MGKKTILVLGAGFGGLRAAIQIAKKLHAFGLEKKYEVILVNRHTYHTYTPLLYEVATTSEIIADKAKLNEVAAYRIEDLINGLPIRFICVEVKHVDLTLGNVHLDDGRKLDADFIVLALGAETNYFGIEGLKENALPLKSFNDALKIRDTIWNLAKNKKNDIAVVVGGGGPTGVEFAAELKNWCGELAKDFGQCRLSVKIVEGMPAILPGFDQRVVRVVETRLRPLGVGVVAGKKIARVEKGMLSLDGGEKIPFDVLVWTGGIKAPAMLSQLPVELEPKGRVVVGEAMECIPQTPTLKLASKIYGLGDLICFYDPKTQKPISAVAPAAIAEADIVAHNIIEEIKAAEAKSYKLKAISYIPKEYPYVIPVGGKYAITKIGPFVIYGFLGWMVKGLIELRYLLSIMPFARALRTWLKGLWIFVQNDRLG